MNEKPPTRIHPARQSSVLAKLQAPTTHPTSTLSWPERLLGGGTILLVLGILGGILWLTQSSAPEVAAENPLPTTISEHPQTQTPPAPTEPAETTSPALPSAADTSRKADPTARSSTRRSNNAPAKSAAKPTTSKAASSRAAARRPPFRTNPRAQQPIPEPESFALVDTAINPGPPVIFIEPESVLVGNRKSREAITRAAQNEEQLRFATRNAGVKQGERVIFVSGAGKVYRSGPAAEVDLGTQPKPGLGPVARRSTRSTRVPRSQQLQSNDEIRRRLAVCATLREASRPPCREAVCKGLWGKVAECRKR